MVLHILFISFELFEIVNEKGVNEKGVNIFSIIQ